MAGSPATVLKPVLSRPKIFAVASVVVLLALAAPALGMKTEQLGLEKQFGSDSQLSVAYRQINESFPGGPAPALVVVKADNIEAPALRKAFDGFDKVTVHKAQNVAEIEVPLPDGKAGLSELRKERLPAAFDGTGAQAYVTGEIAGSVDFNDQLERGIVPVFAFITAVTFLLMLFCFRSYVIAVTSILLNLLSVAAAYGVMVAVFQHGWGPR